MTEPQKATLYSALLPGLGQIHNKKYWKVPIIYAGFASLAYSAYFYTNEYNRVRTALIQARDTSLKNTPTDPEFQNIPIPVLTNVREFYRKSRDLSYIGMVGLYVINIVDAAVDAHLKSFDVSENVSMKITPTLVPTAYGISQANLSIRFYLK